MAYVTKCSGCRAWVMRHGLCDSCKIKELTKNIDILTEAYERFRMKEGGELSFMVVAGMYLSPRKLTEKDIEWGKKVVAEIEAGR